MHQPTFRVVKILNLIASDNDVLTLSEISKHTDIPVGTLYPILKTLVELNFLTLDANSNTYRIGLRLFLDGNSFLQSKDSLSGVESILRELTSKTGETSHFATLDGGNVLYLAKIESPQPVRMYSAIGKQLPAYGTGLGKALMSDMSKEEIEALYPHGLTALTPNTITDFAVLHNQIEAIRKTGFAYECEESNTGVRCIAVPIKKNGKVVAASSIGVPIFRYTKEKEIEIQTLLKACIADVEKIVSYLDCI